MGLQPPLIEPRPIGPAGAAPEMSLDWVGELVVVDGELASLAVLADEVWLSAVVPWATGASAVTARVRLPRPWRRRCAADVCR